MTKDPLEAYAVIVERNLFRTADRPIVVDLMDPNSLEATTLQLDLYGTIAGDDGKGYAIIEERDKKKQRLYKAGDRVAGATNRQGPEKCHLLSCAWARGTRS